MPLDSVGQQLLELVGRELLMTSSCSGCPGPVGVEALDVGEHDELLGAQRDRERGGRGVGVDVVDGSAARRRARRCDTTGIRPSSSRPCDERRAATRDDVADQADVDRLAVDDDVAAARR